MIEQVVCNYFDMPIEIVYSKTRKREIVQVRQLIMSLKKEYTKMSLAVIGEQSGSKDHATVLYACKTINNLIDTNKKFKGQVIEIKTIIERMIKVPKWFFKSGEAVWIINDSMPILVTVSRFNNSTGLYICYRKCLGGLKEVFCRSKDEIYYAHPSLRFNTAYIDDYKHITFDLSKYMTDEFILFIKWNINNIEKTIALVKLLELNIVDINGIVHSNGKCNQSYLLAVKGNPVLNTQVNFAINLNIEPPFELMKSLYKTRCVQFGEGYHAEGWNRVIIPNIIRNNEYEYDYKTETQTV